MIRLRIATKLYLSLTIVAMVALLVGILGIVTLQHYKGVVDEMEQVSQAAVLAERVNGLILAVVMDSRGIYMAQSAAESETYAVPLLKSLDQSRQVLAAWQEKAPVSQREAFAEARDAMENFIRFRTELVRLSRQTTLAEARAYGDNDANRKARSALNAQIQARVADSEADVRRLAALVDQEYRSQVRNLIVLLVLGLVTGIGSAVFVVSRKIVGPLKAMTKAMDTLATGDFSVSVPHAQAHDEIGTMAAAVQVFKDNGIEAERLRLARDQERERATQEKVKSLQTMAEAVEAETRSAVEQVAQLSIRLTGSAGDMAQSAAAVGGDSQSVSSAASQALSSVQAVAAAAGQLSGSIREIAEQVTLAAQVTGKAVDASAHAQTTIARLSASVGHIGKVASLIQDIAAQTNLLALNATIEAARAGEAGKGFAVVANEVKTLANQTAKATDEIAAQISTIETDTGEAVRSVDLITLAITEVDGISSAVASAVEEQGAATQEIVRNVALARDSVQQVSERIDRVSGEAGVSGERAGRVDRIARQVADSIDTLREVLVRIVRTSTKEVDRRATPRFRIDRPGTLVVAGSSYAVTIENISLGGLKANGLPVDIAPGSHVEISISGVPLPFSAIVLDYQKGRLHGKFELSPDLKDQWQQECARLSAGLTAIPDAA